MLTSSVSDRREAPSQLLCAGTPRFPGVSRVRGPGRGGPGQRQGPAPIAAPGAGRGGGGTAAPASEVSAGRGAPLAGALAEPRLSAPPWRRPRGAPRPRSPARAGRATRPCRLHAPRGSSSSWVLSPCLGPPSPLGQPRLRPSPRRPSLGGAFPSAPLPGPGARGCQRSWPRGKELQVQVPNRPG